MARLIDADALKKQWSMADKCEDCPQDTRRCQFDQDFTRMDICEMIDEATTIGGWISVEDELPENRERVVARLSDTENIVCCFYSPDEWWDIEGMWRLKRPTHWMPVIVDEPPEEVKYAWPD